MSTNQNPPTGDIVYHFTSSMLQDVTTTCQYSYFLIISNHCKFVETQGETHPSGIFTIKTTVE